MATILFACVINITVTVIMITAAVVVVVAAMPA